MTRIKEETALTVDRGKEINEDRRPQTDDRGRAGETTNRTNREGR